MKTKPKSGFVHAVRVYYEDTDAAGIVYHASYLKFAERARTEFMRALGYDHHQLRNQYDLIFAVKRITIDYLAPAKLDDRLEIHSQVTDLGAATLDMNQIIRHEGGEEKRLATVDVKLVAITSNGKVLRLPPKLRQILQSRLPVR